MYTVFPRSLVHFHKVSTMKIGQDLLDIQYTRGRGYRTIPNLQTDLFDQSVLIKDNIVVDSSTLFMVLIVQYLNMSLDQPVLSVHYILFKRKPFLNTKIPYFGPDQRLFFIWIFTLRRSNCTLQNITGKPVLVSDFFTQKL